MRCRVQFGPFYSTKRQEWERIALNSFFECVCVFFLQFSSGCFRSSDVFIPHGVPYPSTLLNQNCFYLFCIVTSLPTIKWYKFLYSLPSYRATLSKNRNNIAGLSDLVRIPHIALLEMKRMNKVLSSFVLVY